MLSISFIVAILSPFWLCEVKDSLDDYHSSEELFSQQEAKILERYLMSERTYLQGKISAKSWQRQREFLLDRYVDLVRQKDYQI